MPDEASRSVIVAGGDGSDDSKEALRWAVRQASLTGGVVHVVTAWQGSVADLPGAHLYRG